MDPRRYRRSSSSEVRCVVTLFVVSVILLQSFCNIEDQHSTENGGLSSHVVIRTGGLTCIAGQMIVTATIL